MNLLGFIEKIQTVLEFIVPGFIANCVYNKVQDSKERFKIPENTRLISCICISFGLNLLYTNLIVIESFDWRIIAEIATGVFAAVAWIKICNFKWFRHYYSRINHTVLSESVLQSIHLDDDDQWVSLFLKDGSMVFGRIIFFNNEEDPWIAIDCYKTMGPTFESENGIKVDEFYQKEDYTKNNHIIAVRLNEIKAIANCKPEGKKKEE